MLLKAKLYQCKIKFIITFLQGSIFGQLDGSRPRPIRITARSTAHTDLLMIDSNDFQCNITDKVFIYY